MVIVRLVIALSLIATFAESAASADARKGEAFVQQWCAVCHAVRQGQASPRPGAPRFSDIAADPSTTDASLRGFLNTTPHMAMPKLKLTARDQDEVIAYILSLRPAGGR
jgi:mono/diheme cytochrome c family protein